MLQSRPASRSAAAWPSIRAVIAAEVRRVALSFPLPWQVKHRLGVGVAAAARRPGRWGRPAGWRPAASSRPRSRSVASSARVQRGKQRSSCEVASVPLARDSRRSRFESVRWSGAGRHQPPRGFPAQIWTREGRDPGGGSCSSSCRSPRETQFSMKRARDARSERRRSGAQWKWVRGASRLARRRARVWRFRRPSVRDRSFSGARVDGSAAGSGRRRSLL